MCVCEESVRMRSHELRVSEVYCLTATQGGLHKEPCVCMLTVKHPDLCSSKNNAKNVLDSTVTPSMAYTSSASQLKNKTHQKCPGSLCLVQSKGDEDL